MNKAWMTLTHNIRIAFASRVINIDHAGFSIKKISRKWRSLSDFHFAPMAGVLSLDVASARKLIQTSSGGGDHEEGKSDGFGGGKRRQQRRREASSRQGREKLAMTADVIGSEAIRRDDGCLTGAPRSLRSLARQL